MGGRWGFKIRALEQAGRVRCRRWLGLFWSCGRGATHEASWRHGADGVESRVLCLAHSTMFARDHGLDLPARGDLQ